MSDPSNSLSGFSSKEKYNYYNSLAILLKAVEGLKTTADLRNEASVCGILEQCDGFMNIVMKDCTFTDPRGDIFKYESLFVHARNIRFVHIPPQIPIIPAIQEQLQKFTGRFESDSTRLTFKERKILSSQQQGLAGVKKVLKEPEIKSKDKRMKE